MTVRKLKELLNTLNDDWKVMTLYKDAVGIAKASFEGVCANTKTREYYFIVDSLLMDFIHVVEFFDIPVEDLRDYAREEQDREVGE